MNHPTTVHDMELLKPISVFSKIREDILNKMFTSVINDTGGKVTTGVIDTGSKFTLSLFKDSIECVATVPNIGISKSV